MRYSVRLHEQVFFLYSPIISGNVTINYILSKWIYVELPQIALLFDNETIHIYLYALQDNYV